MTGTASTYQRALPVAALLAVVALLLSLVLALFFFGDVDSDVVEKGDSTTDNSASGKRILEKVAARYASAQFYRDEGTKVAFLKDGVTEFTHAEFKTWFLRPTRLRVEQVGSFLGNEPRRSVIWTDGATGTTWYQKSSESEATSEEGTADFAITFASFWLIGSFLTPTALLMPDKAILQQDFTSAQVEGSVNG